MMAETASAAPDARLARPARLRFVFGGRLLHAAEFRLCEAHQDCAAPPDWNTIPAGVRAVRVQVQPAGRLPRIRFLADTIRYVPSQYRRFYVEIDGSIESYLRKFTHKSRNTLLRKVRKLAAASGGAADFREYARPAEIAEFLGLAREVSAKTYQERLWDAGIPRATWFREQTLQAAARGEARGYLLFCGGRPAAYALCAVRENILVAERLGFDPALAPLNPGTVLLYLLLESLFAEKHFRVLDFGPGEFAYKEHFATGHFPCAEIYYFRRNLNNCLLVGTHAAMETVSGAMKRALDAVGLKNRIRKWIHRRAEEARVG